MYAARRFSRCYDTMAISNQSGYFLYCENDNDIDIGEINSFSDLHWYS